MNDDKFIFDASKLHRIIKETDDELREIELRINNLSSKTSIQGIPFVYHVLKAADNAEQIALLGRALIRISELFPILLSLKRKQAFNNVVQEHPTWIKLEYGDIESEIDEALKQLEEGSIR